MNKDEKIKQLVDRFMAGETSLDEERALYRYFSAGNVAEELMPLREYFCSFASLSQDEVIAQPPRFKFLHLVTRPKFIAAAASIALFLALGSTLLVDRSQNYCEAFVYNKHVTNAKEVMKVVDETMQDIHQNGDADVDNQLRSILGNS